MQAQTTVLAIPMWQPSKCRFHYVPPVWILRGFVLFEIETCTMTALYGDPAFGHFFFFKRRP